MNYTLTWSPLLPFEEKHFASIPEIAGIYEFWSIAKNTGTALSKKYIGQTENLRRRLQEHAKNEDGNPELFEFLLSYRVVFRFGEIDDLINRKQIEKILYFQNKDEKSYIFNKVPPEGDKASSITQVTEINGNG